jgi:hypothetical protein
MNNSIYRKRKHVSIICPTNNSMDVAASSEDLSSSTLENSDVLVQPIISDGFIQGGND